MTKFEIFFQLGIEHIADFAGYDHILFIITLCGVYQLSNWKNVLVLVTAFTIGHSITLALATLNILFIPSEIIEFLIPLTIIITALANIVSRKIDFFFFLHWFKYLLAMFFGLIHGLGFSNYLRSLLDIEESMFQPLLAFNLGLEVGQIAIVLIILVISILFVKILRTPVREWNLVVSGIGLGIAFLLLVERFPAVAPVFLDVL